MDEKQFENTTEYRAIELLSRLLEAHANMVTRPVEFSKDNTVKQYYYGLLNRTIALIEMGLEREANTRMPWEVLRPIENEDDPEEVLGLEPDDDWL